MGHKVNLAEVPETAISSGRWQPLNERLGITHFGISAVVMDPGEEADIEHDEANAGHQEAYVVVTGRAGFRLGDEEVEAGPGDIVVVPAGTPHKFLSRGETHRQISIHPVPRMETEWLE